MSLTWLSKSCRLKNNLKQRIGCVTTESLYRALVNVGVVVETQDKLAWDGLWGFLSFDNFVHEILSFGNFHPHFCLSFPLCNNTPYSLKHPSYFFSVFFSFSISLRLNNFPFLIMRVGFICWKKGTYQWLCHWGNWQPLSTAAPINCSRSSLGEGWDLMSPNPCRLKWQWSSLVQVTTAAMTSWTQWLCHVLRTASQHSPPTSAFYLVPTSFSVMSPEHGEAVIQIERCTLKHWI